MKKPKKCSECGKSLRDWNKSMLCAHHYSKWYCESHQGKAKKKEWRDKNPEKIKTYQKKHYSKEKEHLRKYARNYSRINKQKRKKYAKEYYQNKKENVTPTE